MSVESHGRLLRGVKQAVGKVSGKRVKAVKARRPGLTEAMEKIDREAPAVRAIVAYACELAGTPELPPEPPRAPRLENAPMIHVPDPPVLPPRIQPPRWTKDNRPGPHDILTWEEAMRVPWLDGSAEAER